MGIEAMVAHSSWIKHIHTPDTRRLQLLCFPCAGGSARMFQSWAPMMPLGLGLAAIQLPGREGRNQEPAATTAMEVAAGIDQEISRYGDTVPWIFFGHSFGGFLALETARRMAQQGRPPLRVILASTLPPHLIASYPRFRKRGQDLFAELSSLGGFPDMLIHEPRLAKLWLRPIEADLDLLTNHETDRTAPIPCPITIIAAEDDHLVPMTVASQWQPYTVHPLNIQTWPGGHFATLAHPHIVLSNAVAHITHSGDEPQASSLTEKGG